MTLSVASHLAYLAVAVPLVLWTARSLSRYGQLLLLEVLPADEVLVAGVNRLLAAGYVHHPQS